MDPLASDSPLFYNDSEEKLTLTNTTGGLSFQVNDELNDATAFVVDEQGNVGIGTTNPGYALEVNGDARLLTGNDLYIGDIGLNAAGASATTSGGYLVGLYSTEYYNSASTNVQDVIDDLDSAIGTRTYTQGTYITDDQSSNTIPRRTRYCPS